MENKAKTISITVKGDLYNPYGAPIPKELHIFDANLLDIHTIYSSSGEEQTHITVKHDDLMDMLFNRYGGIPEEKKTAPKEPEKKKA